MLSPDEFREQHPAEELEAELPDSPIGSLRDLQYLYGKLYTLATTDGGKYAPYLTPDEADELVDTDDSLIVVRVDLSGNEPQLADDSRGPVWVTRYTKEQIPWLPTATIKIGVPELITVSLTNLDKTNLQKD